MLSSSVDYTRIAILVKFFKEDGNTETINTLKNIHYT